MMIPATCDCGVEFLREPHDTNPRCSECFFERDVPELKRLTDEVSEQEERPGHPRQEIHQTAHTNHQKEEVAMSDSTPEPIFTQPAELQPVEVLEHLLPATGGLVTGPEYIYATASFEREGIYGHPESVHQFDSYTIVDDLKAVHAHLNSVAGDFGVRLWLMNTRHEDFSVSLGVLDTAERFAEWLSAEVARMREISEGLQPEEEVAR